MTVVSHEREPGELGYVARYTQGGQPTRRRGERRSRTASTPSSVRDLGWAIVESEMLRAHVCRRLSDRLDGIAHGPDGSVDKLLMTEVEQAVGHAALGDRRRGDTTAGTTPGCGCTSTVERRASWAGPLRSSATSSPLESWDCPRHELTPAVRPARRARGRGRRSDPDRPPEPSRAAQRDQRRRSTAGWPTCSPSSTPIPRRGSR